MPPPRFPVGQRVTVRNRGAEWPGTIEDARDTPDGPRYRVRITPYTVAEVGAHQLAPARES